MRMVFPQILGWKIWYGIETTFSSKDGSWEEAPKENVQILIVYFKKKDSLGRPTRKVFSGDDYYFFDGKEFGSSFDDISKCKGIIKYGKWMIGENFEKIRKESYEDWGLDWLVKKFKPKKQLIGYRRLPYQKGKWVTPKEDPTYYLSINDSDLVGGADFNKQLAKVTETANSITVSVLQSATETSYAWTNANVPNNSDWQTGGITVEVNVTTSSPNVWCKVSASRVNSAGQLQETSSETEEQLLSSSGAFTFNIPSMDWIAGNATDRLRINYIFRNDSTHATKSVVISTGNSNTEVTTSITEGGQGFYQPCEELGANGINLVDTIRKKFYKNLTETLVLTDTKILQKTIQRTCEETLSLIALVNKQTLKLVSDSLTLADSISKDFQKTLIETLDLTDSVSTTFIKELTEALALTDSKIFQISKFLPDTLNLTDAVPRELYRILTETLSFTDEIYKKSQRTISNTISLTDTVAITFVKTLAEALSLADTLTKQITKPLTDALTLIDSLPKIFQKSFFEDLSLTDNIKIVFEKTLSETLSLTDSFAPFFITKILSETLSLVDTIPQEIYRTLTEPLMLLDASIKLTSKNYSEILALSDSTKNTFIKTLTESLSLLDSVQNLKIFLKALTESASLIDSVMKEYFPGAVKKYILIVKLEPCD